MARNESSADKRRICAGRRLKSGECALPLGIWEENDSTSVKRKSLEKRLV